MLRLHALFERLRPTAPANVALPGPQGLDALDPAFIENPYPFYAYLREHEPVHRTRSGGWLLTRYDDVTAALSHPGLGNAPSSRSPLNPRNAGVSSAAHVVQNILPFLDRPRHIRSRRMVGSVWRRMLRERTPDIAGHAEVLLRSAAPRFDICGDYARPLAVWTVSQLLGLPAHDAPQLTEWAERFFYLFAPFPSHEALASTDAALAGFRAYLLDQLKSRRAWPGDDLLSALSLARDDEGLLDDLDIVDNVMLLFADGLGNVDRAFANLVLALIGEPSCQAALRLGSAPAERAVEEGLRYDPPGQIIARVAREDITVAGVPIRRDMAVLLALGSANRDEARYKEPDRFRLDRPADVSHLAFGLGRHSCLGAPLVHQQLTAALDVLLSRTTSMELAGNKLAWEPRFGHRWLTRLDITSRLP